MMTYMHVLVEKGPEYFGKERIKPNSMLFFPVRDPLISLAGEESLEHAEEEQKKRMRPDGAFINENPEYDGMIDETSIGITAMLSKLDDYKAYSAYYPISEIGRAHVCTPVTF